jgi:protein TonB
MLKAAKLAGAFLTLTLSLAAQQTPPPDTRPNPDANGIYHIAPGVTVPRLIYSVEPEFSPAALNRNVAANVKLELIVDADGTTRDIHLVHTDADRVTNKKDHAAALTLNDKAIEAVSHYRWEPARFKGEAVPFLVSIEIFFNPF